MFGNNNWNKNFNKGNGVFGEYVHQKVVYLVNTFTNYDKSEY